MSEISLFEGGATNNNFYFLLDAENIWGRQMNCVKAVR